ncbi:MAG: alcohol dehydrogenase catalytic domain-containing protein, partial [Maritimibacter sp.]|nr:alcohol dehydrogenase catalytic domain-containing protein [Maritimibacter sp.]
VVRVHAAGLCHTDLDVMRSNYGPSAFPLTPGHEYAGEVVAVGAGVGGFAVGDRVVIDPNLECGECAACKRGWAHLCEKLGAYGVSTDGGFAEFSVVRADRVHPIGDLPYDIAALAEPMGCVLNGLVPLEGRIVERAAVFGTGPIGLLMGLALKARGVGEVIMVDLDPARLELARGMGLSAARAGSGDLAALRHACDFAVDATGVPAVAAGLVDHVANGGAVSFFGVCPQEARIEISPFEVFRRELHLFGSHSLNHNIPEALAVLRAIGPEVARVVTHRLSADEVAAVMAGGKPAGSLKIQMIG